MSLLIRTFLLPGPGCSVTCQPVSLLAASWGIPIISYSCTSAALSDKSIYPTFTRSEGTWLSRAPVFDKIADTFGWKRIAFITTPEELYTLVARATMTEMTKHGKEVNLNIIRSTMKGTQIDTESMQALREVMISLKTRFHIFIIMTYTDDLRNILITALDEGMLNGRYVFMTNEFSILTGVKQNYRPEVDPIIYNGLMAVGVKRPSGKAYDIFRQAVIDRLQDPVFDGLSRLPPDANLDEVDIYAGKKSFRHQSTKRVRVGCMVIFQLELKTLEHLKRIQIFLVIFVF